MSKSIKFQINYSPDKSPSKAINAEKENLSDEDKENYDPIQKPVNNNSIIRHKKISRFPYDLKNNELLKKIYLINHMKSQKLPRYYSASKG